jgi:hypothetical protein
MPGVVSTPTPDATRSLATWLAAAPPDSATDDNEAYWRRVYSIACGSAASMSAPMLVGQAAKGAASGWKATALELLLSRRLASFGARQGDGGGEEARRDGDFCR